MSSETLTDLGNAQRLVRMHGDDLRFTPGVGWRAWDGRRWNRDLTGEIMRRAKRVAQEMLAQAAAMDSDPDRKKLGSHALNSMSQRALMAAVTLAQTESAVAAPADAFDRDPMLLSVNNGTIDLRTRELRPHRRADLITKLAPVDYDPAARAPLWEEFLLTIMARDFALIDYVQRLVGYSLTGCATEQLLHLLIGVGANGKSTFLEILAFLLGDYSVQADSSTFVDVGDRGQRPRGDIARLAGARLVRCSEIGEGKRFNEALIKSVTGQETLTARFLYSDEFDFRPQFTFMMAANHKPIIRGTDVGIWRRVRIIPFVVTIPEEDRDPNLLAKLRAELPGILAWAVEGCRMWRERPLTTHPCAEVLVATAAYRKESDVLGAFLEECS